MNGIDLSKVIETGGVAGLAVVITAILAWRIGNRMVAAQDRTAQKIEGLTEAINGLRQDLAVVRGQLEIVINWTGPTPVVATPIPTAVPTPVQREVTEYAYHRTPPQGVKRRL